MRGSIIVKPALAALALVLAGGVARADLANGQGPYDCSAAEGDAALAACARVDYSHAESDLKDALAAALLRMHAIDREQPTGKRNAAAALEASEKAWVAYRELGCNAEGLTASSQAGRTPAVLACMARLTASRSAELWTLSGGP